MAVKTVQAVINGQTYNLTLNSQNGKYEATVTAPAKSSYNHNEGHYYPITVKVADDAGNITTKDDQDAELGTSLKLKVKEKTPPAVTITSPTEGALLIDSTPEFRFKVTDTDSGVDAGSGYVYSITGTATNVHDIEEAGKLLRKDDKVAYGDSGYSGIEKRNDIKNDEQFSKIEFRINRRPSSIKVPDSYKGINWDKEIESRKSSTRCKVEHPFLIVKRQFGYAKVAYRGIAKNMNRFHILFASANLVMCARAGRSQEFCLA